MNAGEQRLAGLSGARLDRARKLFLLIYKKQEEYSIFPGCLSSAHPQIRGKLQPSDIDKCLPRKFYIENSDSNIRQYSFAQLNLGALPFRLWDRQAAPIGRRQETGRQPKLL